MVYVTGSKKAAPENVVKADDALNENVANAVKVAMASAVANARGKGRQGEGVHK